MRPIISWSTCCPTRSTACARRCKRRRGTDDDALSDGARPAGRGQRHARSTRRSTPTRARGASPSASSTCRGRPSCRRPIASSPASGSTAPPAPAAGISMEDGIAETLGVKLGDALTFDIAGTPVTAKITSLRKVDWDSFRAELLRAVRAGRARGDAADLPRRGARCPKVRSRPRGCRRWCSSTRTCSRSTSARSCGRCRRSSSRSRARSSSCSCSRCWAACSCCRRRSRRRRTSAGSTPRSCARSARRSAQLAAAQIAEFLVLGALAGAARGGRRDGDRLRAVRSRVPDPVRGQSAGVALRRRRRRARRDARRLARHARHAAAAAARGDPAARLAGDAALISPPAPTRARRAAPRPARAASVSSPGTTYDCSSSSQGSASPRSARDSSAYWPDTGTQVSHAGSLLLQEHLHDREQRHGEQQHRQVGLRFLERAAAAADVEQDRRHQQDQRHQRDDEAAELGEPEQERNADRRQRREAQRQVEARQRQDDRRGVRAATRRATCPSRAPAARTGVVSSGSSDARSRSPAVVSSAAAMPPITAAKSP